MNAAKNRRLQQYDLEDRGESQVDRRGLVKALTPRGPLMTEQEAAGYLKVSQSYLRQGRMGLKPTPAFIRFGTAVRYCRLDLDEYSEQHRQGLRVSGGQSSCVVMDPPRARGLKGARQPPDQRPPQKEGA